MSQYMSVFQVANSDVRYNAAVLFFDVFPLQNHELNVQESDQLLQKQFDLFRVSYNLEYYYNYSDQPKIYVRN